MLDDKLIDTLRYEHMLLRREMHDLQVLFSHRYDGATHRARYDELSARARLIIRKIEAAEMADLYLISRR